MFLLSIQAWGCCTGYERGVSGSTVFEKWHCNKRDLHVFILRWLQGKLQRVGESSRCRLVAGPIRQVQSREVNSGESASCWWRWHLYFTKRMWVPQVRSQAKQLSPKASNLSFTTCQQATEGKFPGCLRKAGQTKLSWFLHWLLGLHHLLTWKNLSIAVNVPWNIIFYRIPTNVCSTGK